MSATQPLTAEALALEFSSRPQAFEIAARELAALRRENAALRKAAPPAAPKLADLRDRQLVTAEQVAALNRAQAAGSLKFERGKLRQVLLQDATGRQTSHFFGDEAGAWAAFCNPSKFGRITGRVP
ncbi:MAG: hypothetical protein ACLPTF_10185 [Steroidobacteraceae bacterium]